MHLLHRTTKTNCFKIRTLSENFKTNKCDAVWDGDGGQTTAVSESIIAYKGNAVGDNDGFQA